MHYDLLIIFEKYIKHQNIVELIAQNWPRLKLKLKISSKNDLSWRYIFFRDDIEVGGMSIMEAGGDTWFFNYPRSLEYSPLLLFQINDVYIRSNKWTRNLRDIDHLDKWPRQILNSNERKIIRHLYYNNIQYYKSIEEFSSALLSLRIYAQELDSGSYSTDWDDQTPMKKEYYEKQNEFREIAARYLKSGIANEDFYIDYINGGISLTPDIIAANLGLRPYGPDEYRSVEDELISSFIRFEREENDS